MIGDNANRVRLEPHPTLKGFLASATIRLDEELLDSSLVTDIDTAPILTDLRLKIVYSPRRDRPKYIGRDYIVICSEALKTFDSRFVDWDDFCKRAETDPVIAFIKKWSPISKRYFDIAKANSGANIFFGIDWDRYYTHLERKFKEKNGRDATAADRLISYTIEGESSVASRSEHKEAVYRNEIYNKCNKGAKKNA